MKKIGLLLLGIVLLVGCTSENSSSRKGPRKGPVSFRKLKDYTLNLSLLSSRREFYAGDERATVIFSLKNTGLKPVTIYEWHAEEAANINLYYHAGKSNAVNPVWKFSPTVTKGKKRIQNRSPLTLNPGNNQAMIQIPLTFLKDLKHIRGKKEIYTIRAVLNLTSVTVESAPTEIVIK